MASETAVGVRWAQHRSFAFDAAVAAALWLIAGLPSILGELARADTPTERVLTVLVYTGCIAPLAWRRFAPITSGFAVAGVHILQLALGLQIMPANVSALFAVYALSAFAPRWAGRVGLATAMLGAAAAPIRYGFGRFPDILVVTLLMAASALAAWLLGKVLRSRRELLQQLTERAERLEREQAQERALAAADERARIAREMHDIVAHSLSVIVAQADGGSYAAASDPGRAREALTTIARTGRESLGEMRRLLGVLRQDEAQANAPLPTLANVEELVDDVRRSGFEAEVQVTGDLGALALPQGAELAAYRVAQEALTNVMKHAGPGARVTVRIDSDAHGLLLSIVDDGRGAAADRAGEGAGQGIRGMIERVGLYEGTIVAQPRLGGGFEVRAHFPAVAGGAG